MDATFPYLAGWRSVRFWPEGMALDPQKSLNGTDTIIPTMRGHWKASGTLVIHGEDRMLQWQAFLAQMDGVIGTTSVPCFSWFRPRDRLGRPTPFRGGPDIHGQPVRRVEVETAAALRATELDLLSLDTTGLRAGQYFSLGPRLHQVRTILSEDGDRQRVDIRPPLRAAVDAGAHVEVDRPVCKMRFTSETEGQFDQAFDDPAPKITVNFEEAL